MKLKIWNGPDYREHCTGSEGSESAIKEINLAFKHWNVRFVVPRFGLSVWKGHNQKARINYPAI